MNTVVKKIAVGVVTGLFLTSLAATSAFADVTADISGNGSGSINSIYIKHKNECSVTQKNKTAVLVEVDSSAHTGGNQANGNTDGDVTVDTGNATSDVTVGVQGGSNTATNPCCCQCDGCDSQLLNQAAVISGNGDESVNSVTIKKKKSTEVKQKNITDVLVGVSSKAKTGKNKAKNNTGGTVEVTTGNADSLVGIAVTSSSNTLNP